MLQCGRLWQVGGQEKLYGTREAAALARQVRLGALSFLYTPEAIRRICWHGTELVRAIAWPIRDENWGTYAPEIREDRIEETDDEFTGHLRFAVAGGALDCALDIRAGAGGRLTLDLTMAPQGGPFATNRAGFTVLHPIRGIAGGPLAVTHSDGRVEQTEFPRLIAPGQPVFDIAGLTYETEGRTADLSFAGEVFEMEDQRNWSDASYKTYCVPLVFPFTYRIDAPVTQSVRLVLTGGADSATDAADRLAALAQTAETAPDIGLVAEPGWLLDTQAAELAEVQHICARVSPDTGEADLARIAQMVGGRALDLELVLPGGVPPEQPLAEMRGRIARAELDPARVIALPEGYLASHQPSGPWPQGPGPEAARDAARAAFPKAKIGGGVLTNFTEFNRCRPDPATCDFITHGNTAIVHAGDDLSVRETLEALPQVFASARAIGGDAAYRLGLIAIGMRSNPYGAAVADNPEQIRRTMARLDPRHRGLFGAAYAVGVLAATAGQGVEALCLGGCGGPFGLLHHPQPWPQPYFDDLEEARVFPIFHVVRAAARMAGRPRLALASLPEGVFAYGAGSRMMIANVTPEPVAFDLDRAHKVAVLDEASFAAAAADPLWPAHAPRVPTHRLGLGPYAIAFTDTDLQTPAD